MGKFRPPDLSSSIISIWTGVKQRPKDTQKKDKADRMTQTPVPPGWYPDPGGSGGQWYWDGRQWITYAPPQQNSFQQPTPYASQPQNPFPQYRQGLSSTAGTIRIHRKRNYFRDSLRSYKVLVDGNIAGRVRQGKELMVPAEAGRHVVRLAIDWCSSQDVEVDVPEGGEVHLNCRPNMAVRGVSVFTGDSVAWLPTDRTRYITLEPRS
jgi:hypothetical protein